MQINRLFIHCILFLSIPLFSQKGNEIGLYGSKHINGFEGNIGSQNPFIFSGYNIGLRFAHKIKSGDFQCALLYTQMDIGSVSSTSNLYSVAPLKLQTESFEIQTLFRHNFNNHKKVIPFISAGLCNFLFTKEMNYNSSVDPIWFEHNNGFKNSRYNAAVISTMGLRCKLDKRFSFDMEPNFKYFIFRNTNYRHQISAGFALTCCMQIDIRKAVGQEELRTE